MSDGTLATWAGPKMLEDNIVPRVTESATAAGRPAPQVIAGLPVMVASDPDAGREFTASAFAIAEQVPAYRTVLDAEGVASVASVAAVTFAGDEEEVAAQLRRFAEAGVTEFVGFLYRGPDAVARSTTLLTGVRL